MRADFNDKVNGTWLIALITLLDAFNSCWFGYDQGVFAGVLVSPDFLRQFPATLDAGVSGITSSCFFLGAFFGAIGAFILGDKLGRRRTIALGVVCNVVGSILQALSWHLPQMIVGRLVNGFGIGLVSSMSPVYLSECAPSHVRGMLLAVGACCNVACFCVANWIAFGLYYDDSAFQWRFPLAFQLIFLIIVAPILFFVPESPRWLLLVDRDEEALHVLSRLAGHSKNIGDSTVTAEFQSIKAAIQMERDDRVPLIDVLCHRDKSQNFRRLILGCGTQFMQQFRQDDDMGKVATAMFILYHVFFGLGYSSVPWVYSAEVSSLGWRTRGAAAATSVNWLGGFVVVQFTKVGLDNLQWRFFLMFGIFCFAFGPVVYFFYPETANRTLEDMDQIFIHNPSAFVFTDRAATQSKRPDILIEAETARIAQMANRSGFDELPLFKALVRTAVRNKDFARAGHTADEGNTTAVSAPSHRKCLAILLIQLYPDAKVICTVRDAEAWEKSMEGVASASTKWFLRGVLLPLPTMRHFVDYINGLRDQWLYLYGETEPPTRVSYNRHMEWLKRTVPADRLIFLEVKDGWEPLCKALGKEVPDVPFPRINDSEAIDKFAAKTAKRGLIRWAILLAGISVGIALYRAQ
ncbi:hypothetical protein LA080_002990 [Diaporthe eres]|nr:hypothetical protein LA080_002990 [Diaporthe eres]